MTNSAIHIPRVGQKILSQSYPHTTVFSSRAHVSQPKRVRQHHTTELLRDQAELPSGWSLECKTPSFAHRLHRLLNGEQLRRLVRFEVPWANTTVVIMLE